MNRPDISSSQQVYAQARALAPHDAPDKGAERSPAATLTGPFTCKVFGSIDDVDLEAWRHVCERANASVFMDPRFIAAVETGMKPDCRFWYAIVYSGDGRPAACACVTATFINLLDFTDPRVAWIIRYGPNFLSRFKRLEGAVLQLAGLAGREEHRLCIKGCKPAGPGCAG